MTAVQIFRVGPLDDAGTSLYVPVSQVRSLEVVDAQDDAEGIAKIIEQWPEGSYHCSPDLAAAASRLGVAVAPLEAITEGTRIWTAMSIAESPDLDGVTDPWSMLILMRGAQDFLHNGAARRWPPRLAIDVELRGDRRARWSGALLVAPYPGVALFGDAGCAKQCALLDDAAQQEFLAQHDHLLVQFEPAPEYVAEWIRDLYRIEQMPRLRKRHGDSALADDEDALVIGGVLSALGMVEDVRETVYSLTRTPGREVRTFVSPGSPWPFLAVPGMPGPS